MQGHTAFTVELGTGHFSATQTAGALDTDTLCACTLCGLDCLLHCTAECNTRCELLCDALCNQLSGEVGVSNLEDVQLNLLVGELLELAADAVCFCATAANHDTGTSGVDVHTHAVTGTLDLDLCNACAIQVLCQQLADLYVLADEVSVTLAGLVGISEPLGDVVSGDAQSETVRVNFLTHLAVLLLLRGSNYHGDVAGALVDSVCATLSAGLNALHGRALVHECFADEQLFLAEGQTLLGRLLTSVSYCRSNDLVYRFRSCLGGELQNRQSLFRLLTTDQVDDTAGLHRRNANETR